MAKVSLNYDIETNRGDMLPLTIRANNEKDKTPYIFQVNDVVRFKIMKKKQCDEVVLQKDVKVTEVCESVQMIIPSEEMKIGEIINKPVDYWYEVELNPDTPHTVTILGYTKEKGPKILSLTPEGGDKK